MKTCLLVPALLLLAGSAYAQFTATVLGTVTDASGSVVTKAVVTLTNSQTGVSEKSTTDDNGDYRFLDVRVGRYHVQVQAPGFKTATTEEFAADVAARQRVDLKLEVGQPNQTIDVQEAASALETDSSNRGQVIEHNTIVDLPLNGREYADLALLAAGVRKAVQSNTASRDGAYDVNGMRSAFNSYNLDGLDNNAYGTSNQGFSYQVVQAAPDAIQEFRFDTRAGSSGICRKLLARRRPACPRPGPAPSDPHDRGEARTGDVWVNSPAAVPSETLGEITGKGPVRYLVAGTPRHVWRLSGWRTLFPEAELWGWAWPP
jgi:hypothetical protein